MRKLFKSISEVSHEQRSSTRVTGKEDRLKHFTLLSIMYIYFPLITVLEWEITLLLERLL